MSHTPDSPVFTADELSTWSAFATLLEWLPPALDTQLSRDSGITHFEFGILFALSRTPDRTLRMSDLAGYANSTLSRLSRAVHRLEQRDWVHRHPDPTDGRYTLATLTDDGVRATRDAEPGHVKQVRRLVFDSLTPTQTRQLREISAAISGAIRKDPGWNSGT